MIFRQYDGDRHKFRMEVYAEKQLLATQVLPGSICALNMQTGGLVFKRLVKPDIKAG